MTDRKLDIASHMQGPTTTQCPKDGAHRGLLALIAGLTAIVLVLTAPRQIFDTNFYTLWEATALLAGDHPYRDFYEWGVPLQAAVSAAAQLLVGYRLIGEFLVQWLFILIGGVLSFHLGLRLSQSIPASLATALLALAILAATPTFHYPKLFLYPLTIWLAWWYMERPSATLSAVLGWATAVAFLLRHDHGAYIAGAAALAFALARLAVPASRNLRAVLAHSATYGATVAAILAPWVVVVHINEGLPEYVRSRAYLYGKWSAIQSPYRSILTMNPVRVLAAQEAPAPKPAVVSFEWHSSVDEARRHQLESQGGLRWIHGPDAGGLWHYEASNAYDVGLLELIPYISNTSGFAWDQLQELRSPRPIRANALMWLEQVTLLIPILLLASAGMDSLRSWYRGEPIPVDTYRVVLAATFLAVIDARLFREPSYVVVVAPLTAALSARLLVGTRRVGRGTIPGRWAQMRTLWSVTRWSLALTVLLVTSIATFVHTRGTSIFEPFALAGTVGPAFAQLLASPPIDGYQPADPALRYDWAKSDRGGVDKERGMMRYLHDCTRAGDRVLVTGSTPYHVGYYIERPIAGGHLFWHHEWRSDAAHEMQSLALLQNQSVPFAFSTTDPVLEDFKTYPRIRQYLTTHYAELEGTGGLLLVDTRRQPTGRFGAVGFPCFR